MNEGGAIATMNQPTDLKAVAQELGLTLPGLYRQLVRKDQKFDKSYAALYSWAIGDSDPGFTLWSKVDTLLEELKAEFKAGPTKKKRDPKGRGSEVASRP